MTTYKYQDQEGEHLVTRDEIIKTYYPWWCEQMRKVGKEAYISEENCVDDWLVVHWAWDVSDQI